MKKINAKGKSVLIIGDTHLPYEHCDYRSFCEAVSKKYNCKIHIHIGDEVDNHAISFHPSESELFSAGHELELAIEKLKYWNKSFPKLQILESNHGSLLVRRLKVHGIPVDVLKPLKDIYETPNWLWHEEIMLDTHHGPIYLCHGKSGVYNKLPKEIGVSCVQGHYHGKFEITWSNTVIANRFNMFVGCGVNRNSLAFAYGKNHIPKPILGCGVIDENGNPHLIRMILNKKNRWDGKL